MSRFIVLGRDSILTGYNSFEECLQYIRETRKKYPNHVDMTIYKMEFKE